MNLHLTLFKFHWIRNHFHWLDVYMKLQLNSSWIHSLCWFSKKKKKRCHCLCFDSFCFSCNFQHLLKVTSENSKEFPKSSDIWRSLMTCNMQLKGRNTKWEVLFGSVLLCNVDDHLTYTNFNLKIAPKSYKWSTTSSNKGLKTTLFETLTIRSTPSNIIRYLTKIQHD